MIAQVVAPATFGGLETVVGQLLGVAHSDHFPMVCFSMMEDGVQIPQAFSEQEARGARIVRINAPHRRYLHQYRNLVNALREAKATAVHTHGAHADVLGGRAARKLRIPHIATLHGFVDGGLKSRILVHAQCMQLRSAAKVIAVSDSVAVRLREVGVAQQTIQIVPNSIPEVALKSRAEAREFLVLAADAKVVGWVGRLSSEKGPLDFVEVLSRIAPADGITGCMIGDGPQMMAVREKGRALSEDGRLKIAGLVPNAREWLAAFDAIALTSVTEGTPMIVLEAMRAGIPVVSTRVGGVPALLAGDAGRLVPHGQWDEFANAVVEVISSPMLAQNLALAAHTRVSTDYSEAGWWGAHKALYSSVLTKPSTR